MPSSKKWLFGTEINIRQNYRANHGLIYLNPKQWNKALLSISDALNELRDLESETSSGLVSKIVAIFLTDTPKALESMKTAVSQWRLAGLHKAAHKLKSSSAYLGA